MTAVGKLEAVQNIEQTGQTFNPGRPVAGGNPAKRDQILDGAKKVFALSGFDGASMNDITRAAGVSKGTIYVYFQSKEELFAALIQREREHVMNHVQSILQEDKPLEEVLFNFGMTFAKHMTSQNTIKGMRMVLGVIDNMPEVARAFLSCGPTKGAHQLKDYLLVHVESGALKIDDTLLAARQLADLCLCGQFRPALFGESSQPPKDEELVSTVRSAVKLFLNAYSTKQA